MKPRFSHYWTRFIQPSRSLWPKERFLSRKRGVLAGRLEPLEPRIAPAYTVSLIGSVASFQGSAANESLVITESGGLLQHNRAADPGFADAFDFDTTTAGSQHLAASSASIINIDDGGGADSITEIRTTDFVAGNIHAPGGAISLNTTGAITQGATGVLTASTLAIAGANGVGLSTAPISTAVSGLVASATNTGIFLSNTGALTIGFAGDPFQGVRVSTAGSIVLTNDSTINVARNAVANEIISAPGDVTVNATGMTADIVTGENLNNFGNGNPALKGSIVSTSGNITLAAGRDLLIGNPAAAGLFGNVLAQGNLILNAGRNINVDSFSFAFASAFSANAASGITATATGSISLLQSNGSPGALFETQGGPITLTGGANSIFTANSAVSAGAIQSNGGTITIAADDMVINDKINAGAGVVALHQVTLNRGIDLGTNSAGNLGLTDTELDHITATTLRIGNTGTTTHFNGFLTISAPISQAGSGYSALSLNADAGNIGQSGGATITEFNLAAQGGSVLLTEATNNVLVLAGSTNSFVQFGFQFINSTNLTIGTVDGVAGISGQNSLFGDITVSGPAGSLITISQPVTTPNGRITFNFDDATVNAAVTAPAKGLFGTTLEGHVNFFPVTAGRQIDLGTNTPGKLGLTDAELDQITAGTSLSIGSLSSGNITVTNPITSPGTYAALSLRTNGTIVDSSSSEPAISGTALAIQAATGFTLNTAVSALAFSVPSGSVTFQNTGAVTMRSVDTLNSSSVAGSFTLTASGAITFAGNVSANGLTATATDAPTAGNDIIVNGGVTLTSALDLTLRAGDNLTTASGSILSATGQVTLAGDVGNADSGVGTTIRVQSTFIAGNPVTITGGVDRDTFFVSPSNGQITIGGGAPSSLPGDTLIVDAHRNTPTINHLTANSGTVTVPGFTPIAFSEIELVKFQNLPEAFVPGSSPYGSATNYTAHKSPKSVTLGDVNGDGIPDLLVANSASNDISIMLGVGNGTFKAPVNIASGGTHPVAVALAQLNSGGNLDIVVANSGSNAVDVLLGNGDGTFQTPVKYATGKGPASLKLGFVNLDGNIDIVTADAGGTVSVLTGNGDGTFTKANIAKTAFPSPRDVVIGDFNSDGKADLVVASAAGLSFFAGDNSGKFTTAPVKLAAGAGISSIATGDFNSDGVLDVVVTNSTSKFTSVFLGTGSASGVPFGAPLRVQSNTGYQSVVVQDFNGDGLADIAMANSVTKTLDILLGLGNGTFSTPYSFKVGGVGTLQPLSIAVGDLDADGRPDIVVATPGTSEISVLLRVG